MEIFGTVVVTSCHQLARQYANQEILQLAMPAPRRRILQKAWRWAYFGDQDQEKNSIVVDNQTFSGALGLEQAIVRIVKIQHDQLTVVVE